MSRIRLAGLWTLPLIALLARPTTAWGQEVSDLWSSTLEFGFTGASGNSSFGILTAGTSLNRLDQERLEFDISLRVRWGRSGDRVIANDQAATLKFDWLPLAEWSPFLYANASADEIRSVDSRFVGGGGLKWTLWRRDTDTKFSISGATLLDYEVFEIPDDIGEDETSNVVRFSGRVKFDYAFGSGARLQHITFWQPRLSDFGDYVIDMSNSLSTPIASNLSLVIDHSYIHDEIPPPGASPDDQRLSVVLRVSL